MAHCGTRVTCEVGPDPGVAFPGDVLCFAFPKWPFKEAEEWFYCCFFFLCAYSYFWPYFLRICVFAYVPGFWRAIPKDLPIASDLLR